MNINRLGNLTEHPDIPEWLVSKPVAVPYFDGLELTFTLDGFEERDEREVNAAIDSFLMLTSADRFSASSHVFRNYRRIADIADEEDLGCTITTESDVWKYVRPSEVFVSRRSRRDRLIYIRITASCDWEREHGLQIIYRQGIQLSRVSDQDGHLTYSDAFHVPEDQDRIS